MAFFAAPTIQNIILRQEFTLKRLKTNFKVLNYQILTSVKKLEKKLRGKANFSIFLLLNCFNFKLKLFERP